MKESPWSPKQGHHSGAIRKVLRAAERDPPEQRHEFGLSGRGRGYDTDHSEGVEAAHSYTKMEKKLFGLAFALRRSRAYPQECYLRMSF
jgi:hypothetical protein